LASALRSGACSSAASTRTVRRRSEYEPRARNVRPYPSCPAGSGARADGQRSRRRPTPRWSSDGEQPAHLGNPQPRATSARSVQARDPRGRPWSRRGCRARRSPADEAARGGDGVEARRRGHHRVVERPASPRVQSRAALNPRSASRCTRRGVEHLMGDGDEIRSSGSSASIPAQRIRRKRIYVRRARTKGATTRNEYDSSLAAAPSAAGEAEPNPASQRRRHARRRPHPTRDRHFELGYALPSGRRQGLSIHRSHGPTDRS